MRECKNFCDTRTCVLCKQCLPGWLPAVALHRRNFEVKKREPIFKEGDPVTGIYFIYSGKVKVHKKWDSEKELIIRFAGPGDIFGIYGLGKDNKYPNSATALEPSIVCYLDIDFFETTLNVNTKLTYNLMHFFANELQCSQKSMRDLAHMSVKARIAQCFITLKNQFGIKENGTINIELSRQDIASFAGASYETLFKVINDFSKDKLIYITGRNISILNEVKLLDIIEQDNV